MLIEFLKFILYSGIIVLISKKILVKNIRKLAEGLNLKPRTVGNIAGISTSIPELLTVTISSFSGFFSATIYNILSSNIINFIQYLFTIITNKNLESIKNKAIKTDIILVIATILIPLLMVIFKFEVEIEIIPIFLIIYLLFIFLNKSVHKRYLIIQDMELEEIIEKEEKQENKSKKNISKYLIIILFAGILLFVVGELLGNVLEKLAIFFNISEILIGILLGFVTSIPELITFFESQKHYKDSEDKMLGVVEATNNLFASNTLNLYIIQCIGILIYVLIY